MLRTAPTEFIYGKAIKYRVGGTLNSHALRSALESVGYINVQQVMAHGEFAVRGSIIDLFPMGSASPLRIDLFDDEIDTIKVFDPETQRSREEIQEIDLLPAHEFGTDEEDIERFRINYRNTFTVANEKGSIYSQESQGSLPAGIE